MNKKRKRRVKKMKMLEKIREFFGSVKENKRLKAELDFNKKIIDELMNEMSETQIELEEYKIALEKAEDDYTVLHYEKSERDKEFDWLKYELNQSKEVAFAYQVQAKSLAKEMNEFLEEKAKLIEELESLEDRVGDLEQLCEMKDEEMDKMRAALAKANRVGRELQEIKSYFTIKEEE